jgi:2-desacetyl-2-hydroxyethyl bacteriochlorophyllide A dehydrogenase
MRALVTRLLPDKRREKVLVEDWPEPPDPVSNQIKTETVYSGITNGTERNDLLGGNYAHPDEALPAGWGYQNVGRVTAVGPEAATLRIGDLAYLSADHMEYVVMPENGLVVKLPDGVDPQHAAVFGMASVAMRTCRNADLRMGERVLVVGAGCVGQFAAQIARVMGARVTICEVDARRREIAQGIGAAEEVVGPENWTEAAFDAVIDFAGVPGMEDQLIGAARPRGRVLFIAGRSRVEYTFNLGQGREITIKQNSHFDRSDLENLTRLVAQGLVKIGPVIRDVVPVAEAKAIYDTLRDRPSELLGTVFVW